MKTFSFQIFDNWRYVTMHKARHLKNNMEKTGGGESSIEKLTAMEEKAISLWGKLAMDANPDLGSVGVETCEVEFLDEYLHIASIPSIQSSQTAQASQPVPGPSSAKRARKSAQPNSGTPSFLVSMFNVN